MTEDEVLDFEPVEDEAQAAVAASEAVAHEALDFQHHVNTDAPPVRFLGTTSIVDRQRTILLYGQSFRT